MKDLLVCRGKLGIDGLNDLMRYISFSRDISKDTVIEIGAYKGESAVLFAQRFKKVITIDPFVENYDEKDITCKIGQFDLVYSIFSETIKPYSNIHFIHKTSDDAVKELLKEPNISLVYIDGEHTYEQVTKDLINYIPLITPNGFIGGHDYFENHWLGVKQAINEIVGTPDCRFVDSSWLKNINKLQK